MINNQDVIEQVQQETAQGRFDKMYISNTEIMRRLNISRTQLLYARRTGKLPEQINVTDAVMLWEREKVEPILEAWKVVLEFRKGV